LPLTHPPTTGASEFFWPPPCCLASPRGAAKKKIDGPPRTFAKSRIHPPTIRLFFLDFFFRVRFWAFLGKGSSKTPLKYFGKKSMSETFSKISTKQSMSVFPRLCFVLSRFRVFFSDGKHYKKRFAKKSCRKVLTKQSTKNPKPTFSRFFFIMFLGVSRGEFM
jgi:hypothetical protein